MVAVSLKKKNEESSSERSERKMRGKGELPSRSETQKGGTKMERQSSSGRPKKELELKTEPEKKG